MRHVIMQHNAFHQGLHSLQRAGLRVAIIQTVKVPVQLLRLSRILVFWIEYITNILSEE